MEEQMDMRAVWEKYSNGDGLSDTELGALIAQAEAAMPYLESRSDFGLARTPTALALIQLKGFRDARKRRKGD